MDTERKNIILVDDDPTNLAVGSDALDEHYDVLTLNSGARLLNILEKKIPDLILLDVEMPEMNGYEVIKQIKDRAETADIPVIFLTAKTDTESEIMGLSLGAVDYITKPFSPPLLLKRIEMHLLLESQKKELINFNNNLQDMVKAKTASVFELQNAILKTMAELVEFRDDITGSHIERTQKYLSVLLNALTKYRLYEDITASWDTNFILPSAQLHDIGKIAIKDSILQKPGKLTDEEFEEIKKHPVFGKKVIQKIKENTTEKAFLEYAEIFAISHHEKWDGSGYPYGLKGEEIPLLGRLMAIADVYDALVSERPYKKPFTHEEAVKIIAEGSGKHFDPAITDMFLRVSDEFDKIAARGDEKDNSEKKSANPYENL
jgi:putative two-component system response regulator